MQSEEHYDTYMLLRQVYNKRMRERLGFRNKDTYHRLLADQHMIRELSGVEDQHPERLSPLTEIGREYAKGVDKLRMRDWVFRMNRYSILLLSIANLSMLVSLLVFLYGFITNYLPYLLIEKATAKMKDVQFHSSVKLVAGLLLFPIYYFILFIPVWILTDPGWIKWAFLASLPLTGLFAHAWYIWAKKLCSLWRYQIKTISRNKQLLKLKELRKQLLDITESLIPDPTRQDN